MNSSHGLLSLILLLSISSSLTFAPRVASWSFPAHPATSGNTNDNSLHAQSGDFGSFGSPQDEDDDSDKFEGEGLASGSSRWTVYNDFPLFLTQCSIQSFLFLLKSMRDPHTVVWMENFTQPAIHLAEKPSPHDLPAWAAEKSQLLSYHGLHAMNTTRFPTWESYFSELIEQPQEIFIIESSFKQFPDYELEINPVRLCTRLLSVRQQIAREFVKDLDVIAETTNQTMETFREALGNAKDGKVTIERANLMFLDLGAASSDIAPSPLRKGNFDLLSLLTTQEAIHRVLNDPERQSGVDAAGNKFLKDFYLARMVSHFSGSQRYRRADHFFEELLGTSPNLQVSKGETTLVNPAGIAEVIIRVRQRVALEWKNMAEDVPEEHLEIQRLTLNQMLSGGSGTSFEDALRGNSNIIPESKKEVKKEPEMEVVAVGDTKKEAEKTSFDLLKLPPMSVLWTEGDGVNMNATGVFE